ncbi:MAG: HlyD family type I secretion periplasmic adaptor subunit, partial [Proteobacteria bacterium]|nr:HlyD family type I secretion periplasmic adaptor subunit [Pseudomonadota bacterium]
MSPVQSALKAHVYATLGAVLLVGGTATAWSLAAKLDGAVVVSGIVAVEGSIKKVQHPTGGVVRNLLVKEGQRVAEGDIVIQLDDTQTKASLAIVLNDLGASLARLARLRAEQANSSEINFPSNLVEQSASDAEVAATLASEKLLLSSRLSTRNGQKAQLRERIGQSREEIRALSEQQRALELQLTVARGELLALRPLESKQLVQRQRITALERELARYEGQLGEYLARQNQAHGKISEIQLQVLQLDKDAASEIAKDLRETETKIGELNERKIGAEDQLRRVDIRAPISGTVHQLAVHTVGGVVTPSEPAMLIVPQGDRLIVEVRIPPQDIEQVHLGQQTRVRFAAFDSRVLTPEANGTLSRVAADIVRDSQTGQTYYLAGVMLAPDEIKRLS